MMTTMFRSAIVVETERIGMEYQENIITPKTHEAKVALMLIMVVCVSVINGGQKGG
jgi:hypothetical protein